MGVFQWKGKPLSISALRVLQHRLHLLLPGEPLNDLVTPAQAAAATLIVGYLMEAAGSDEAGAALIKAHAPQADPPEVGQAMLVILAAAQQGAE